MTEVLVDARARFDRGPFISAQAGDAVFLIEEATGDSFRLDGAGPRYWELLCAGQELGAVAGTVTAETDATEDVVADDLVAFVHELVEIGALVPVAGDARGAPEGR